MYKTSAFSVTALAPRHHLPSSALAVKRYEEPVVEQATSLYDAARLLARCSALFGAIHQAEASQRLGLSATDIKALEMVGEFESLTIGQLMQLTGLSAGGTTAVVDRLEAAGYITRDRHHHDRRITVLRPVAHRWAAVRQSSAANLLELTGLHHVIDQEHWDSIQLFLNRALEALHQEAGQTLTDHGPQPTRHR